MSIKKYMREAKKIKLCTSHFYEEFALFWIMVEGGFGGNYE